MNAEHKWTPERIFLNPGGPNRHPTIEQQATNEETDDEPL